MSKVFVDDLFGECYDFIVLRFIVVDFDVEVGLDVFRGWWSGYGDGC